MPNPPLTGLNSPGSLPLQHLDLDVAILHASAVILQPDEPLAWPLVELRELAHVPFDDLLAVEDDGDDVPLACDLVAVPDAGALVDGLAGRQEAVERARFLVVLDLPLVLRPVVVEDLDLHAEAGRRGLRLDVRHAEEDAAVAVFGDAP